MRIRILSDLHREFGPTDIPKRNADLILLAGDISTKQNALPWIREFCGDTPTACLCGNHEFYGDKLPRVHIHHNCDYHIGATRILANPQGYPETPNESFDPGFVMEVEPR